MNKKRFFLCVLVLGFSLSGYSQDLSTYAVFQGDTLNGFDMHAAYQEALAKKFHGREINGFLWKKQQAFVSGKYHLPAPAAQKHVVVPSIQVAGCTNMGFEAGTFTGWTGGVGYNANSLQPLTMTGATISTLGVNSPSTSCSYHTIVTTASGNDPYTGLPPVPPGGGTYAVRLGGENINVASNNPCQTGGPGQNGAGGETLQQTFLVSTSNALFTYKASVLIEQAATAHDSTNCPYFRVEILDSNNQITNHCEQYFVQQTSNAGAPPGFLQSPVLDNTGDVVFYSPWTSTSINLTSFIGHPVTVRFTAAGCAFAAHFCYAYIDASCGPVIFGGISGGVPTCVGNIDSLTAPSTGGTGTYSWSTVPPGQPGIVGPTNGQQIHLNANGTYQVVVTYANGCSYTLDTTITFRALPVAVAAPTNVTCHGLKNGMATATVISGTGPFVYSWSPAPGGGQGTATATGLDPAITYTVHVSGGGGCASSTIVNVTEPPVLTATNSHINTLCNGGNNGSATVTPAGGTVSYTYSWSPSGGSANTASGLTAGIYTCHVTDKNGCTVASIDTVGQPAPMIPTNIPTNVLCHGSATGADTMMVTGGTSAYTFSWSPINSNSPKPTGLPAGTYTCTITDAHNCLTTTTAVISEPALIVLTPHSRPTPCGGANGSASVSVAGGTGTYTYSWASPVSIVDSVAPVAAGVYTVTVTDANGCVKTSSVPVSNTNGPKDSVLHSTQVTCFGGSNGAATVIGTGGTGILTYSWSPAVGTGGTGITDTTATSLTAGSYLITVIDGLGCKGTTSDTIHQPALVTATAAVTNVNCNGQNNGQAVLTTTGGHPGYTYTWSPSGGNTSTGTALVAGTYTCTIADTNACPGRIVLTITQPALLTTKDTIFSPTCFGTANGSVLVTATGGVMAYTYSWSGGAGTSPNASGLVAGTYTCITSDSHGCTSTQVANVTQPAEIIPTNTTQGVTCNGLSNGTATATGHGGNTGAYTYSWTPAGGTAATTTALPAGTYTCTVTDTKGCSGSVIATISQPNVLVAGNNPKNISCNGMHDGAVSCNTLGGTSPYTYSWSPSGGIADTAKNLGPNTYTCLLTDAHGCTATTVATIIEPAVLRDSINPLILQCFGDGNGRDTVRVAGGTTPYTYSWSPAGGTNAYVSGLSAITYTCLVTDAHGCVKSATVSVSQPSAITATHSSVNAICKALNGTASVVPAGGTGPYSYSWTPIPWTLQNLTGAGPNTYTCMVNDANGCKLPVVVTIGQSFNHLIPGPYAYPVYGVAPDTVSFADSTRNAVQWSWVFGDGGSMNGQHTSNVYTDPGIYTVTELITDQYGCDTTGTLVIHVKEHPSYIKVPNVFTPNDDGKNDLWEVKSFAITEYDLKIYDRWGTLMAHFTHPWLGWDGLTFSGSKAAEGTYYYVITATGDDTKTYALNGFFSLLR